MQSTMSWPLVCIDVKLFCQVSPPSRNTVRSGALGADRFQHRRDPVETAEPAVAFRKRREILRGQRIGLRAAGRDLVEIEKIAAGDVRHLAARLADADVDRRLAEQHRHELRVDVGEVHQRDIADRLEAQQIGLGQSLLRETARSSRRA